jgi:hypothetical protein
MKQLRVLLFATAAACLLSACNSEPEADLTVTPEPGAAARAAAAAKAKDPVATMARAVGNGKPGAAVEIRYDFVAKPALGKPVEVDVALIPSAGVESMDATVSGMDGIVLAGNLTAEFNEVEAGKPYEHSFSLLAERAGVFYITVSVNTKIGGSTLGRTFSIPLSVGDPPVQAKAAPQKDATGQAIQPMKAQESSR